jgi:hypothetical protein
VVNAEQWRLRHMSFDFCIVFHVLQNRTSGKWHPVTSNIFFCEFASLSSSRVKTQAHFWEIFTRNIRLTRQEIRRAHARTHAYLNRGNGDSGRSWEGC